MPKKFTIEAINTLPATERDKFDVDIVRSHDEESAIGSVISSQISPIHFKIKLSLNPSFFGYINHLVVIELKGEVVYNSTCSGMFKCFIGVLVRGSVVDESRLTLAKKLSLEAKPFVPLSAIEYFDYYVRV